VSLLSPLSPRPADGRPADCSQQDEQFSLVFTIASFMNNFMTFPMGVIFDRFGTAVARLIAMWVGAGAPRGAGGSGRLSRQPGRVGQAPGGTP